MDSVRFLEAVQNARLDHVISIDFLLRTLTLESWLRHLATKRVLMKREGYHCSLENQKQLQETAQSKSSAS